MLGVYATTDHVDRVIGILRGQVLPVLPSPQAPVHKTIMGDTAADVGNRSLSREAVCPVCGMGPKSELDRAALT